jgi:ankyrin repeat protein
VAATPLQKAVKRGDLLAARTLLAEGALPDDTSLLTAVTKGDKPMIRLLLERGANANGAAHGHDFTPLVWAAIYGNVAVVKILLEAGASVFVRPSGYPLLNYVSWRCHSESQRPNVLAPLRSAGAQSRPDWWLHLRWRVDAFIHGVRRSLGQRAFIREPPWPPPIPLPPPKERRSPGGN